MGTRIFASLLVILLTVTATVFSSCDLLPGTEKPRGTVEDDPNAPLHDSAPMVLDNVADGVAVFSGNGATVDFSHINEGYIMAKYEGDNPKIKLQITKTGSDRPRTYTYDIDPNTDFASFPVQESGGYTVAVFTNIEDDRYSQAAVQEVQAELTDEFSPYLRPNQYSNFTYSTQAVAKSTELAQGTHSELKVIENIFVWITENVTYDYEKAATVQSGYIPDVDATLLSGAGICFDYAALMTCMLRSQHIPCKLVVGYAGSAYHAWISVYVQDIGWVDNMIQFNGDTWTRMDPTFAAGGDTTDPNVIGDGETYNPIYFY
jgi:transglutaminase/protease-like cytokinesis protein 3